MSARDAFRPGPTAVVIVAVYAAELLLSRGQLSGALAPPVGVLVAMGGVTRGLVLGLLDEQWGDHVAAAQRFEQACEVEGGMACWLANDLRKDFDVPRDEASASEMLRRACPAGDKEACY